MNLRFLKIVRFFHLVDKEKYNLLRQISFIEDSGMFDTIYYLKQNSKVKEKHLNPIEHYVRFGWKEGRNPSAHFDNEKYLKLYPELYEKNISPLFHYIRENPQLLPKLSIRIDIQHIIKRWLHRYDGKSKDYQLIAQSKYFNEKWYIIQYLNECEKNIDPVEHYLKKGWRQHCNPSRLFDNDTYLNMYESINKANMNPLLHYEKYGKKENRQICKAKDDMFTHEPPNLWDKYICSKKQKNPLISIIVISYNCEHIITHTLDSIVNQTYKNFELIIVDDGSKDSSIKLIKKYVKKYPFIQLHRHNQGKNRGLFETVKLGIKKAHGKYISFCFAGNYWTPNHLEEKIYIINHYANPKIVVNDVQLEGNDYWCKYQQILVDKCKIYLNKTKNKLAVRKNEEQGWIIIFFCSMIEKSILDKCNIKNYLSRENMGLWRYYQVYHDNTVFYINKKLTCGNICVSYITKEEKCLNVKKNNLIMNNDSNYLFYKRNLWRYMLYKLKRGERKICQNQPCFSIIMPTYNRVQLIESSINSLLNQTYQNFELIIIDDGSTDGTEIFIKKQYNSELKSGKIKYIYKENSGVCKTRNVGLQHASKEWIAYLDSDNFMDSHCLERFSSAILQYPQYKTFYANLISIDNKKQVGKKFDYNQLMERNYIDLGVFCHHKSVYEKLGGFDENMTRLVDWDLIVRYTKEYKPYYINEITLYYNDADNYSRITNSAKLYDNMAYFRKKNCNYPKITTIITTYNHQDYICEAIESAIKQKGKFIHEIVISDDGSTDKTPQIIVEYAEQYPHLIRNISSSKNIGISANMKKCFEAATGKYIAVLEGDDYWTDTQKLEKQMQFLEKNKDCSMVFSRVRVYNEDSKKSFLLERHKNLSSKLTGKDFIKEMSLIVNFSCTMYRRECLLDLPEVLYESRLSEIALAMYLENKGKIGFISTPLSIYRQNSGGVWSGSDKKKQLQQGLISRQTALAVCASKYKKPIQKIIEEQYEKPLKNMEES